MYAKQSFSANQQATGMGKEGGTEQVSSYPPPSQNFSLSGNFFFFKNFSTVQNLELKFPILGEFRGQIELLSGVPIICSVGGLQLFVGKLQLLVPHPNALFEIMTLLIA